VRERIVDDVSELPTYGFRSASGPWWGTIAFMTLEGMGFAIAVSVYLYLYLANPQWPLGAAPPGHWPATILTLLLLASVIPNWMAERHAKDHDLRRVRRDMVIMSVIGAVALAIRFFEFTQLGIRWDDNAYGSILWVILALHTTHLITDLGDTLVLAVLMFTRHGHGKRFSDVDDNAYYWYFVVLTWLPLYALLYWVPRWSS
jgi:heme/copper-type cytochrome/quinol oxidase subunit 3